MKNHSSLSVAVVLFSIFLLPSTSFAACEKWPLFVPDHGRTSSEAWEADRLVDSIGITVHPWAKDATLFNTVIKPRLLEMGVRNVRTNFSQLSDPDGIRALGTEGIRYEIVTDKNSAVDSAVTKLSPVASYVYAIEGYNEPEGAGRSGCGAGSVDHPTTCWVASTTNHQMKLFSKVKSSTALDNILVLGPSLQTQTLSWAPSTLGSLNDYLDANNMHRYRGANNYPEIPGYLGDLSNVLEYVGSFSKPSFLSETGYNTAAGGTTETADAVFTLRTFLYNFDHGLAITGKYELLDTNTGSTDIEENFGYLRDGDHDWSPKPSFYAVKNLISILSDPGARFVPGTLSYSLTGETSNVYKVLMQKRDGTYYLALWLATSGITDSAHSVSVNLPAAITAAAIARPNDSVSWSSLSISGGKITVSVDSKVSIIRLSGTSAPSVCSGSEEPGGPGPTPDTCTNVYSKDVAVRTGFGAAYDLFSSTKDLLLKGTTCTASNYSVEVGDSSIYTYKNGYRWSGSSWELFTYEGGTVAGDYRVGLVTKVLAPASTDVTHFVAYTCKRVDDTWKCGCGNTACDAHMWQLQGLKR